MALDDDFIGLVAEAANEGETHVLLQEDERPSPANDVSNYTAPTDPSLNDVEPYHGQPDVNPGADTDCPLCGVRPGEPHTFGCPAGLLGSKSAEELKGNCNSCGAPLRRGDLRRDPKTGEKLCSTCYDRFVPPELKGSKSAAALTRIKGHNPTYVDISHLLNDHGWIDGAVESAIRNDRMGDDHDEEHEKYDDETAHQFKHAAHDGEDCGERYTGSDGQTHRCSRPKGHEYGHDAADAGDAYYKDLHRRGSSKIAGPSPADWREWKDQPQILLDHLDASHPDVTYGEDESLSNVIAKHNKAHDDDEQNHTHGKVRSKASSEMCSACARGDHEDCAAVAGRACKIPAHDHGSCSCDEGGHESRSGAGVGGDMMYRSYGAADYVRAPEDPDMYECKNCHDPIYEDNNRAGGKIWVHSHGSTVCGDSPSGSVVEGTVAEPRHASRAEPTVEERFASWADAEAWFDPEDAVRTIARHIEQGQSIRTAARQELPEADEKRMEALAAIDSEMEGKLEVLRSVQADYENSTLEEYLANLPGGTVTLEYGNLIEGGLADLGPDDGSLLYSLAAATQKEVAEYDWERFKTIGAEQWVIDKMTSSPDMLSYPHVTREAAIDYVRDKTLSILDVDIRSGIIDGFVNSVESCRRTASAKLNEQDAEESSRKTAATNEADDKVEALLQEHGWW